jgi:hypothetical protein
LKVFLFIFVFMICKPLITISSFLLLCSVSSLAIGKKQKTAKAPVILIEAYTRQQLSGRVEGTSVANTFFVLSWTATTPPEMCYWRGNGAVVQCKMEKAHKVTKRPADMPPGIDYTIERIPTADIKTGDTLMFTSLAGCKDVAPASVLRGAANTLFIRTGSKWSTFPVKVITKKAAIAMP